MVNLVLMCPLDMYALLIFNFLVKSMLGSSCNRVERVSNKTFELVSNEPLEEGKVAYPGVQSHNIATVSSSFPAGLYMASWDSPIASK